MGGLRRKGSAVANWMAGAVKPSHKGLFSAKAKRAGKSTAEYAKEEAGAPGALGREARLAKTFAKFRPKKKLRDHMRDHISRGTFKKAS
jgi:hypothetical protein